jgi:CRP-like cAMP-binding protein
MVRRTQVEENGLLKQLGADDFSVLKPCLEMFPMVRGAVLYESASVIDHVYFPLSGMVSLLTVMRTGEQIETAIVGREGVVGASIASHGPNSFCTQATVQIPGMAWRIPSKCFLKLYEASAHFRQVIDEFQSIIVIQTQQSAACNALHTVEARVCRWLLQTQDVVESDKIQLTQEALALMLGVQRTAVSQCAMALHERGLIEYSRGNIKILSRSGLEKCACECYEVVRRQFDKMAKSRGSIPLNRSRK